MYVCICSAVTDRQISQAVNGGAETLKALRTLLGVCGGCCKCARDVKELIGTTLRTGDARPAGFLSTAAEPVRLG